MSALSARWKAQIQEIIDISRNRIQQLEAGELRPHDAVSVDETRRKIEAEMKVIARLQQTMDALP